MPETVLSSGGVNIPAIKNISVQFQKHEANYFIKYFISWYFISWSLLRGRWSRCTFPCCPHSVQFSCSVVSVSLWPHGLQHARLPCPSPTPGANSNLCPSSQWCHPTTSSSVVPFSSRLQSFSASGSFLMSQLFTSGGQSIGVSASASLLPVNIQDWFPFRWTGWISQKWRVLNGRCQAHSSRVWSKTRLTRFYFYFL